MRSDQQFEIERAFDLLPHVVGASWAVIWFRLNGIKRPTPEEFRTKVLEYFSMLTPLFDSYPISDEFSEMVKYIQKRQKDEIQSIREGNNPEIEKRYERYIDYG